MTLCALKRKLSASSVAVTLLAINTSSTLGGNVLYVSRDGETFKKNEPVTVSVSGPVGAQDPEGQSCCGGGTDGTWEFYDISDHQWSGQKVTGNGTSATLDTSSHGQITATCTAKYNLRCTGDSSLHPIPLSGSGTVTIEEGNGSQGYAPAIEPATEQFILPHDSEKFTLNLSDEGESGTPTNEEGWTANTSTKRFLWNYSGLQGSPASGTDDTTGTLELDRDQPGTAQVTVKRQDDHDHEDGRTGQAGNSPASGQVKVKVQVPTSLGSKKIIQKEASIEKEVEVLDQDKQIDQTGNLKWEEKRNITTRYAYNYEAFDANGKILGHFNVSGSGTTIDKDFVPCKDVIGGKIIDPVGIESKAVAEANWKSNEEPDNVILQAGKQTYPSCTSFKRLSGQFLMEFSAHQYRVLPKAGASDQGPWYLGDWPVHIFIEFEPDGAGGWKFKRILFKE